MDTETKPPLARQVAARRAVEILGGWTAAARALNVKDHRPTTVQSWIKHRVPAEYCPAIERETRARGEVVRCEDLRPDIPWGILREQAAPADETPEVQA